MRVILMFNFADATQYVADLFRDIESKAYMVHGDDDSNDDERCGLCWKNQSLAMLHLLSPAHSLE